MAQYFHLINLSFVRHKKIKIIYNTVKDEMQSNSSVRKFINENPKIVEKSILPFKIFSNHTCSLVIL